MPIHLPEFSRRQFLKQVALVGAGVAVAPASYAGLFGKSRDKHTFFFLSDSHVAADGKTINLGVNMADHLTACVKELMNWPVKPGAVFVSGDLAFKRGAEEDYATFNKLIKPARGIAPIHLTMGNHDERDHFWKALPEDIEEVKTVPRKQMAMVASVYANWFMIDSLEFTDVTDGRIGVHQLNWLDAALKEQADKPAIIVCHHNLKLDGMSTGLKDTEAMEAIFKKHRHVKAFVFGHTHNWNVSEHSSGVQLVNLPPTSYVFKEGLPTGWVRCTLNKDGAEFELRSLDPLNPEHGQVKNLKWRE